MLGRYVIFTQNLAWPMPAFFVESWSLSVEMVLCHPAAARLGGPARRPARHRRAMAGRDRAPGWPLVMRCLVSNPADHGLGLIHIVVFRLDAIAWV